MSKQEDIFEKRESDSISDDSIRRSLLGCADAAEQASFEALLMIDDQFAKRVGRLEFELSDDFTFERLTAEEQQLFTDHFLVTRDRAKELAVSQALRRAVADKSFGWAGQTKLDWRSKLLNLFALDRPFAKAALAVSALLFCGALFWLIFKAPTVRTTQIAKRQPVGKEYAHPVASQSPADKLAGDSGRTETQIISTVPLRPDNESDGKATVQVSNSTSEGEQVRLELLIESAAAATYQATLMRDGGAEVISLSQMLPVLDGRPKVVLDVPAELLSSGHYYIDLKQTSEEPSDAAQRYSFQVKKE